MTCGNEYNDKEIRSTQTLTGHGLLTLSTDYTYHLGRGWQDVTTNS